MILKLRDKLLGDHVHVDVFIGPDTEHLAKAGTLVFRVHEWRAFGVMISLGSTRMAELGLDNDNWLRIGKLDSEEGSE